MDIFHCTFSISWNILANLLLFLIAKIYTIHKVRPTITIIIAVDNSGIVTIIKSDVSISVFG